MNRTAGVDVQLFIDGQPAARLLPSGDFQTHTDREKRRCIASALSALLREVRAYR